MSESCPNCAGTGFVVRHDDRGLAIGARCECRDGVGDDARVRAARIPRRYEHCTFEHFECHDPSHAAALATARAWVDAFPAADRGLLFVGGPGRGKTHLAVAVLREVVATKGCRGLFWEQDALLRQLRDTWDRGEDGAVASTESHVWREIDEAELLVLDDLGSGRTTSWRQDVLREIITRRYNEMRSIIITTNLRLDEPAAPAGSARGHRRDAERPLGLRDHLGDALLSRLTEMCQRLDMRGQDYRSEILPHRHP